MIKELILRQLRSCVSEVIHANCILRYASFHTNNHGESTPWLVLSYDSSQELASFRYRLEATDFINKYANYDTTLPKVKELTYVVMLRQQKNQDRDNLIAYSMNSFNVSKNVAERLVFSAVPEAISEKEAKLLRVLDEECSSAAILDIKRLVSDIFEIHLKHAPMSKISSYEEKLGAELPSVINSVCYYLIKNRNLV